VPAFRLVSIAMMSDWLNASAAYVPLMAEVPAPVMARPAASVAYKRFSLRYEYFANGSKTGNPIPMLWTHTHVVTADYAF
jgi:hypothetical protein